MYKKLLLLFLLPLVSHGNAKIPVGWNTAKGVALGAAITAGGAYITSQLAGDNSPAQQIGAYISLCAGTLGATWYMHLHDPFYRFGQLKHEYNTIQARQLTHALQTCRDVNDARFLLRSLGNYYVIDQNPYYQAFVDMTNMRAKIRDFLHEAHILYNHFYRQAEAEHIESLRIWMLDCDTLYTQALVTLKATPEYVEAMKLQQAIEQTQRLDRIEQLAWHNTLTHKSPKYHP